LPAAERIGKHFHNWQLSVRLDLRLLLKIARYIRRVRRRAYLRPKIKSKSNKFVLGFHLVYNFINFMRVSNVEKLYVRRSYEMLDAMCEFYAR